MVESAEQRTLRAQCHCGSVCYEITLPITSFPLGVHLCHCSICRYTHGTLCIFHTVLPTGVEPRFVAPSSLDRLTGYRHARSKSERFFCSACGCHMGDRSLSSAGDGSEGQWIIASSLFLDHGEDVFQIKAHCLTSCAPGGGLHEWLPSMGDRELRVWNPKPDDPDWDMTLVESAPEFGPDGSERLRAQCHCGGVSFTIPRPSVPEVSGDPHLRKWVSPVDPSKWVACLDVCDDCRLVNGTHATGWAFVPRALLEPPLPRDLSGYGTMKSYSSSEGVLRGFCGVCGATAVYRRDDRAMPTDKHEVIDVSVGILRAPAGVTAEDWLTWRTGQLSWHGDGLRYSPVFARSLREGLSKWGEKKQGRALDFVIGG